MAKVNPNQKYGKMVSWRRLLITGYDKTRQINNITFENLKINGRVIADNMSDKPTWYKTGDMANFFIGEHVEGIRFIETKDSLDNKSNPK